MIVRPAVVNFNSRRSGRPAVVAITITLIALILNGGCSRQAPEDPRALKVLRVVLIPDRPAENLERDFRPLLDYIAAETGFSIELLQADSYEETLAMFARGQVDLVRFGGYSFVLAKRDYEARALVMRDIDLQFRSVIIAHTSADADGLESLRGRSLGFGSPYSTSGHVMPRAFFKEQGIEPEEFFSDITYANNHVENITAVQNGEIDLAVVNSMIFEQMSGHRNDILRELRIVWTSPSYANYVWAMQPNLDIALEHSVREAFLALTMLEKDHEEILRRVGASGFVPVLQKNYDFLMTFSRNDQLSLP